MKVGFFLLKFPLSSETFVLNQITAFIDMGYDVEIIALQKGDTQNTHAAYTQYGLEAKTRWLQDEPSGKLSKLRRRAKVGDKHVGTIRLRRLPADGRQDQIAGFGPIAGNIQRPPGRRAVDPA